MLAIDTNILVRLVIDDDPRQATAARALLEEHQVLVASTVLLEAEWVFRSAYGLGPAEALASLKAICGLPAVILAEPDRVAAALAWASDGMDFADALHLAGSEGCDQFVTFDRKLARTAAAVGMPAVRIL